MIIEINYKALHWDNHQGGSGKPFNGRLLRNIGDNESISDIRDYALRQLALDATNNRTLIGDYRLVNIVIDEIN